MKEKKGIAQDHPEDSGSYLRVRSQGQISRSSNLIHHFLLFFVRKTEQQWHPTVCEGRTVNFHAVFLLKTIVQKLPKVNNVTTLTRLVSHPHQPRKKLCDLSVTTDKSAIPGGKPLHFHPVIFLKTTTQNL